MREGDELKRKEERKKMREGDELKRKKERK